jgi:predicted ATPase with chaperone activity
MALEFLPTPVTIQQTGITVRLLDELALKMLYLNGEMYVTELADKLRVGFPVADQLFQRLRRDMFCEVTGMTGGVHRITLTSRGRARAVEALSLNQYVGPCPVSLFDYIARVKSQTIQRMEVTPARVQHALSDLVLDPSTVTQVGTAMASGKTVFLYGSTGSGKTSVAECLAHVFEDETIWIPYAVELDGDVITIFDPILHERVEGESVERSDPRWSPCRRPCVKAGGELTLEMLDLEFNPVTKFYTAPIQMKANNGLLIIDDFGRQRMRPTELLNRWIIPLDRRIDYLTLRGGRKLEIPFDVFVIFATNLQPSSLVEEAFLRRLHTKVKIDTISSGQFREIFRRTCNDFSLVYQESIVDELIQMISEELQQPLRGCYPRDLIQQISWEARYRQETPALTRESLQQACRNYFVAGDEELTSTA